MSEPIKTVKTEEPGRPVIAEEQYQKWLDEMAPLLRQGCSLYYAMDKMALTGHQFSIYEKYKLGDWFSKKVDAYRAMVGDLINNVGFKVIENINTRMVETNGKSQMTSEEVQVWRTMAEKHRAAQPFFVTRTETAETDDSKIGKILDNMESTDYDKLANDARRALEGQVVASNPSVQGKEQDGANSDVHPEPNATPASS